LFAKVEEGMKLVVGLARGKREWKIEAVAACGYIYSVCNLAMLKL